MPIPFNWRRIIDRYNRGAITSTDLTTQLSDHAERIVPGDYEEIVAALRAHNEEFVRTTVAENVVRLVSAARKEIDYAAERELLAAWFGCKVEVYGGYAFYSPNQTWLAGRERHEGTLAGDFKVADNRLPVAVVQLGYELELSAMNPACRGRLLLLSLRYRGDTWESGDGVALAYVFESLPRADRWQLERDLHEIESHASYRFTR